MAGFDGSLINPNTIPPDRIQNTSSGLVRNQMAERTSEVFRIPLTEFRVWDAMDSPLAGTPPDGQDDLGLITGTWLTDAFTLQSEDVKTDGATNKRAGLHLVLPAHYNPGGTIKLRVRAGMMTAVADTSATIDVEAVQPDGDGAVGSDLVSTGAQNMNSLTAADFDFTIDGSSLVGGDELNVRITAAINDGAGGSAVIATIYSVSLLCDVKP